MNNSNSKSNGSGSNQKAKIVRLIEERSFGVGCFLAEWNDGRENSWVKEKDIEGGKKLVEEFRNRGKKKEGAGGKLEGRKVEGLRPNQETKTSEKFHIKNKEEDKSNEVYKKIEKRGRPRSKNLRTSQPLNLSPRQTKLNFKIKGKNSKQGTPQRLNTSTPLAKKEIHLNDSLCFSASQPLNYSLSEALSAPCSQLQCINSNNSHPSSLGSNQQNSLRKVLSPKNSQPTSETKQKSEPFNASTPQQLNTSTSIELFHIEDESIARDILINRDCSIDRKFICREGTFYIVHFGFPEYRLLLSRILCMILIPKMVESMER